MFKFNVVMPNPRTMSALRSNIRAEFDQLLANVYFPRISEIAKDGADLIRKTVQEADTRTGLADGRRGRILTGKMIGSVGSRVARNKLSLTATAGFINNPPSYTEYQELGTRTIQAMHSTVIAREYMLSEIQKLGAI